MQPFQILIKIRLQSILQQGQFQFSCAHHFISSKYC